MTFHPEVLSAKQRKILPRLGSLLTTRQFYLAGGTALALRLGHRRSADFDWMTRRKLADPIRLAAGLRDALPALRVTSSGPGTLHARANGVRISLLEYRYSLLRGLIAFKEFHCALASIDDLACMKLSALAQRGSRKDFVDVYALMAAHAPLDRLLKLYTRKFHLRDAAPVLYALAYFAQAEAEPMPSMLWRVNWERMKKTIQGAVRDLAS